MSIRGKEVFSKFPGWNMTIGCIKAVDVIQSIIVNQFINQMHIHVYTVVHIYQLPAYWFILSGQTNAQIRSMETFQGCTTFNYIIRFVSETKITCSFFIKDMIICVSRRYTINNKTISPSNLYVTVIQISDFPFRLASQKACFCAVLLGKQTNTFFMALRIIYW